MDRILRRSLLGLLAGALSSAALILIVGHLLLSVLLGMLVGAAYSASLKPTRGTYVDNLMAGGALGVPLWGLISVIAIPLFSSRYAGVGRGTNTRAFPGPGRLGAVWRRPRPAHSNI